MVANDFTSRLEAGDRGRFFTIRYPRLVINLHAHLTHFRSPDLHLFGMRPSDRFKHNKINSSQANYRQRRIPHPGKPSHYSPFTTLYSQLPP